MKIVLLLLAALCAAIPSSASEAKLPPPMRSEAFISPIKKIYSVQEGDRRSVAYVVVWHGQEVIALPVAFGSENDDFIVGDSVRCLKHEILSTVGSQPRFIFSVLGSEKGARLVAKEDDEVARMQSWDVDVALRRAQRDPAAK